MLDQNKQNMCNKCFLPFDINAKSCPHCGTAKNTDRFHMALPEGTILLGKYVVGKVLGKGGFGITYLCYDFKLKKRVAIKEYLPDTLTHRNTGETLVSSYDGEKEEQFLAGAQKFYEEAKLVSRFNGNPNIISVYEFFYENNTAYFVMEYLDGIDLKKYISQNGGKLNENQVAYIVDKMCDALIVVHSMGILHRDISPDNIFICTNGDIKLIDFGAARQVIGEASRSLSVILKQGFAPLEQYQKHGNQGPWTDIYALGATLYYTLTGKVIDDAMTRISEDILEFDNISATFENVLRNMLAVKIEDRYQSAIELKKAVNEMKISFEKLEIKQEVIEPEIEIHKPEEKIKSVEIKHTQEQKIKIALLDKIKKPKNSKKLLILLIIIISLLIVRGIVDSISNNIRLSQTTTNYSSADYTYEDIPVEEKIDTQSSDFLVAEELDFKKLGSKSDYENSWLWCVGDILSSADFTKMSANDFLSSYFTIYGAGYSSLYEYYCFTKPVKIDYSKEPDPKNHFAVKNMSEIDTGFYYKYKASDVEWIMKYIFGIEPSREDGFADPRNYYYNGYYYFASYSGLGGGYTQYFVKDYKQLSDGKYEIQINICNIGEENAYATGTIVAGLKNISGNREWVFYSVSLPE